MKALVIAAAQAFCAENPPTDLCDNRTPPVAIEASAADLARLESWAGQAYIRARMARRTVRAHDRDGDAWRIGSPRDRSDDCEDRVLWIAETLRRDAPALYAAFRPVMIVESRTNGITSAHLVGVIETTDGAYVVDPRYMDLQRWRHGDAETYAPEQGIGGRWTRYGLTADAVNVSSVAPPSD